MDTANFFEKLEGTWFSQRTTHVVAAQPSQVGQCTLAMTRLAADDPSVISLCKQFTLDAQKTVFAFRIEQESRLGTETQPTCRATVMVGLQSDVVGSGPFLTQTERESAIAGQYHVSPEAVLTLITETDQLRSEERLWFLNPNLRMRTSLVKRADGLQISSFCSEIRRMVTQPAS